MKIRYVLSIVGLLLLSILNTLSVSAQAATIGTAFTYQGSLLENGVSVTGNYDFRFTLHDQITADSIVSLPIEQEDITVTKGVFTTVLDFGDVFTGQQRFLEIEVRQASELDYTTLNPRQPLTPVPYALYALNSPAGEQGLQGPAGITGTTGMTGPIGLTGAIGLQGEQGLQGLQGDKGEQGLQGPAGITGATGMTGPIGLTGAIGLQGEQGLQGLQGDKGEQGLQGPAGITGATGMTGPIGLTGAIGLQGEQGLQGLQGDKGEQGLQGPAGITGATGMTGPIGLTGAIGLQGEQGLQGLQGDKGEQGLQGPAGITGTTGMTGPIGLTGAAGPIGFLHTLVNTNQVITIATNGGLTFDARCYNPPNPGGGQPNLEVGLELRAYNSAAGTAYFGTESETVPSGVGNALVLYKLEGDNLDIVTASNVGTISNSTSDISNTELQLINSSIAFLALDRSTLVFSLEVNGNNTCTIAGVYNKN